MDGERTDFTSRWEASGLGKRRRPYHLSALNLRQLARQFFSWGLVHGARQAKRLRDAGGREQGR